MLRARVNISNAVRTERGHPKLLLFRFKPFAQILSSVDRFVTRTRTPCDFGYIAPPRARVNTSKAVRTERGHPKWHGSRFKPFAQILSSVDHFEPRTRAPCDFWYIAPPRARVNTSNTARTERGHPKWHGFRFKPFAQILSSGDRFEPRTRTPCDFGYIAAPRSRVNTSKAVRTERGHPKWHGSRFKPFAQILSLVDRFEPRTRTPCDFGYLAPPRARVNSSNTVRAERCHPKGHGFQFKPFTQILSSVDRFEPRTRTPCDFGCIAPPTARVNTSNTVRTERGHPKWHGFRFNPFAQILSSGDRFEPRTGTHCAFGCIAVLRARVNISNAVRTERGSPVWHGFRFKPSAQAISSGDRIEPRTRTPCAFGCVVALRARVNTRKAVRIERGHPKWHGF